MKKQWGKRIAAMIVCAMMVIGIAPGLMNAKADPQAGQLYVCGKDIFTTERINGDTGYADLFGNELTLNNFSCSGTFHVPLYSSLVGGAIIYEASGSDDLLRINLQGKNTLRVRGGGAKVFAGIFSDCNITIAGTGELYIIVDAPADKNVVGISCSHLVIDGATIDIKTTGKGGPIGGASVTVTNFGSLSTRSPEVGIDGDLYINNRGIVHISSNEKAIGGTVYNATSGAGWTNIERTEGYAAIPANVNSKLDYKSIVIPYNTEISAPESKPTAAPTAKPVPTTGDSGNPALWLGMVLFGIGILAVLMGITVRKSRKQ